MSYPLVDSHCHLNFKDYEDELTEVIDRAQKVGLQFMTTIGTSLQDFPNVLSVAERFPFIYASIGIHPHDVAKESYATYEDLAKGARHPKVIGIGETGLDFYYDHSPRELQKQFFRLHCQVARDFDLPLIVHTRDAEEETLQILKDEMQKGIFKGLIHCFTASQNFANEVLKLGFYISVSGIITFKKAEDLRNTIKEIPLERLLIETDSPYLAPIPHRGKRNEPAFVLHVAEALAELKETSISEVAKKTTQNYLTLFTKVQR